MVNLMEVKNLTTRFYTDEGTVHAVNGISYTLREGETLGVVGESGCGKSVHALSLMGLIPSPPGKVTDGSVVFRGRDLLKLSKRDMRLVRGAEIAMIFQDPMTSLNPVLTIGKQITEALELHLGMDGRQARARAIELLAMVGIPLAKDRVDDYPHQFSGGMRQRAMIAMGLSCNPQLLIADEATTALDVTIQAQILDLVRRLREKLGMAMIWISHDLGVVASISETVQVMYAGFIVERAPVDELYKDTRHPYTLGLLNSLPRMDQPNIPLIPITGAPPDMRQPFGYCPFVARCPFAVEKCSQANPLLEHAQGGHPDHTVACWVDVRTAERRTVNA